jgi:hypothetical protein
LWEGEVCQELTTTSESPKETLSLSRDPKTNGRKTPIANAYKVIEIAVKI